MRSRRADDRTSLSSSDDAADHLLRRHQRAADPPRRPGRHARHDDPRRLRRRRAHRAPRRERDGPLPRASGVQGRPDLRRLPQGQRDGRAHGRLAERLHLARPRRLPHHRARRGGDGGHRPAHRLRRAPEDRSRRARQGARRRHPGDPALQGPARRRGRGAHRPRALRRPPAGPHRAGPRGPPADLLARGDRGLPRAPLVRARAAGAFIVGNIDHVPANGKVDELFGRFPDLPEPEAYVPAPAFEPSDAGRAARLQPVAPAHELPPAGRGRRPQGARRLHHLLDAAGRLDGLAPVRRDPRAARAVLLGLRDRPRLRRRARAAARLGPRVEQVRRGLHAHARDRRRAGRRRAHAARRSSGRAPTPPAGASWPSRTPTRSRATRPTSGSSSTRTSIPTRPSPCSTRSPSTRSPRRPARSTPTSSRWRASGRTRAASSHSG